MSEQELLKYFETADKEDLKSALLGLFKKIEELEAIVLNK